jgi:hypothetical protein
MTFLHLRNDRLLVYCRREGTVGGTLRHIMHLLYRDE